MVEAAGLQPDALPGSPLIACIGPITAATARQAGLNVDIVAQDYTTEGLVKVMSDE